MRILKFTNYFLFAAMISLPISALAEGKSKIPKVAKKVDLQADVLLQDEVIIHKEGADFIKVHFSDMKLPKNVYVEVLNESGSESYKYHGRANSKATFSKEDLKNNKKSFSAMSITGDTAIVRVIGNKGLINKLMHKVQIDYIMQGDLSGQEQSIISPGGDGDADFKDIECYKDSHPEEYERAQAVARLLMSGGSSCTAWRVGENNHMISNNHCVSTQEELLGTEVWFNFQSQTCGSHNVNDSTVIKVTPNQLLATDQPLDFVVFTLNNFASIQNFGHLGLDIRIPDLHERIYIPHHGWGYPKWMSVESDMNASGFCEIDFLHKNTYFLGSDYGYYCDTVGGASGSPVISQSTHRVIALHHMGGNPNGGVKMTTIWPLISSLFNGVVPSGSNQAPATTPPPNELPVADFSFTCDEFVCQFDASLSTDDKSLTEYFWRFGATSTTYMESDPQITFTFPTEERWARTYSVSLSVLDSDGAVGYITKEITVQPDNFAPNAKFSATCEENTLDCRVYSNRSSDSDGSIVNYHWDWGDGTTVEGPSLKEPEHTYASAGTYLLTLTITDNEGKTSSRSQSLSPNGTVTDPPPANVAPTANFSFACTDLTCNFADGSSDNDGSIASRSWSFGDGSNSTASNPQHSFASPGTYSVTLTVTDNDGANDSITRSVTVTESEPPNQVPTANFSFACTDLTCNFADGSSDSDGNIASHSWSFGDGSTSTASNPQHSFASAGTYSVTLTVTDNDGANDSITRSVTVSEPAPPPAQNIELSVRDFKQAKGYTEFRLSWSGANTSQVDIYQDGSKLLTTSNDGSHSEIIKGKKPNSYKLCESGTNNCSKITYTGY